MTLHIIPLHQITLHYIPSLYTTLQYSVDGWIDRCSLQCLVIRSLGLAQGVMGRGKARQSCTGVVLQCTGSVVVKCSGVMM